MRTTYMVTKGVDVVGKIAKSTDGSHWADIKALVAANPGAEVKPVVTITNACTEHSAFDADNCPSCGTSRMSR